MRVVSSLDDPGAATVGGKVRSLLKLSSRFPVPPLIGLTFTEQELAAAQSATFKCELPGRVRNFLARTPNTSFAVRSSADVEDSRVDSFAGLFDTVLAVPASDVCSAIGDVLRSSRSLRVVAYCRDRGVNPADINMGVAVQHMIAARTSGVAFSRNPIPPTDTVLIEAVAGLGEPLVQGLVTPESWVVNRGALEVVRRTGSHQREYLQLAPGGGTQRHTIMSTDRRAPKLTSALAIQVAHLALDVEANLHPEGVDIEWAIDSRGLWLLQARPITTTSVEAR